VNRGPVSLLVPEPGTLRPLAVVIAAVAAVLLFRLRWSVLRTLAVCAALGVAAGLAGLPVR
jgi:chromate transporter